MEHDLDDEAIEVGPDGSETIAPLSDPLEIPIGWVEVTIRQVVPNPERGGGGAAVGRHRVRVSFSSRS